jgi:hypothetical protein
MGCWECVVQMEKMRNAYNSLVLNPQGKEPVGKTRCKWKNNKMYLGEMLSTEFKWFRINFKAAFFKLVMNVVAVKWVNEPGSRNILRSFIRQGLAGTCLAGCTSCGSDLRSQAGKWYMSRRAVVGIGKCKLKHLYSEAVEHYKEQEIFLINKPTLLCELPYKSEFYL